MMKQHFPKKEFFGSLIKGSLNFGLVENEAALGHHKLGYEISPILAIKKLVHNTLRLKTD